MLYNIGNRRNIPQSLSLIFLLLTIHTAYAQTDVEKLSVYHKWHDLKRQVAADSTKRMVELKSLSPGIVYDLRYATTNNFMHRSMYPKNTTVTFMRLPAAIALAEIQKELNLNGYGLKIFDAYRPYSVTVKFWELVHDERYVANPAKGSGHNRGIAADLTIIDMKTGKELDMGTGFDNFTDTAHQTFTQLPLNILANRELLRSVMEKHGFKQFETEWWHYFLADGDRFEVLDFDFKKLNRKF